MPLLTVQLLPQEHHPICYGLFYPPYYFSDIHNELEDYTGVSIWHSVEIRLLLQQE